MTATKTPNVAEFKRWMSTGNGFKLAKELFLKMAIAEMEREGVNAYVAPIFAKYGFRLDNDHDGKFRPADFGRLLGTPREMYLSRDEEGHARFYAECDVAHRAHGFTGPDGHCPALVAEHDVIKAEWALLIEAGKMFGFDGKEINGHPKQREGMIELLLGAAAIKLKK